MEIFDQYKDPEEEKEKDSEDEEDELDSEDENIIYDDFIDWNIDFTAEILKAKKKAAFSKKSVIHWSG